METPRPDRSTAESIPASAWLPHVERRRLRLASGVEIALLDWGGDGPLALLHHANGFCAGVWGLVADALRDSFRVVAMDARGHGDSSRPTGPRAFAWDRFVEDLVDVAVQLAAERGETSVALGLGHSFGGTSLLAASARRPGLFGRLVLVDPVTLPPAAGLDSRRLERSSSLAEGARRRQQRFASREQARQRWAGRPLFARFDPRALDLYAVHGLRELPEGGVALKCPGDVEAAIFSTGPLDVFALAPRVVVPTLLLWARQGNFPRSVYQALADRMPAAHVEDVDAGHLVPMERPELVVAALRRFCAEASGPQGSVG